MTVARTGQALKSSVWKSDALNHVYSKVKLNRLTKVPLVKNNRSTYVST